MKFLRNLRQIIRKRQRLFVKYRRKDIGYRFAVKRRVTGNHFVKHNAQAKNVSAFINRFAPRLLRRHIAHGPQHLAGFGDVFDCRHLASSGNRSRFSELHESEVQHFDVAIRSEHHICGLDIAMNDPFLMCVLNCMANLYE